MTARRHLRLIAMVIAVILAIAACAPGEQAESEAGAAPTPAEETTPQDTATETEEPDTGATEGSEETAEAELPAEELRLTLERQLGHHATLAIDAMRAGVRSEPDFEAAAGALSRNTDDLTSSIELVYGAEGAQAFRDMWENHIGFFVDYTVGLAEGDQQAQDDAKAQLEQYRQDFSSFMETASEGNIPADLVAEGLQAHVNQLIGQIDAFHAGDYEAAYTAEREAYAHMFGTAKALAGGIAAQFPDRFPAEDGTQTSMTGQVHTASLEVAQEQGAELPAVELRSLLRQQLGEHAQLAMIAMRKGVTGAEDFEQAAGALSNNTDDLTGSIELVYGAEGAEAFRQLWENHIGFFVDYTVGLAEGDQQAQDDARAQLEQYRADFAAFIEGASEGEIPADAVSTALQGHVDQLIGQIDAYHAGDFETAYDRGYEAYTHMFDTADALAGGIAAQFPDRFSGGQGSAGGMDHSGDATEEATEDA